MTAPGADAALAGVAAYGLATTREQPTEPLEQAAFAALLLGAERHRILGLLGAAVGAGDFPVTDDQHDLLEQQLQAWLAHALRVERLLLVAVGALADAAIDHRVLKGVALAHSVYPDPAWRVFGDVDLLVPPDMLTRAASVLEHALPAAREAPELRPGFDDRFGKEVLLRVGALELDLHRTFVEGALGLTLHLPDLWEAPDGCVIGGRGVAVLPAPQRLLHAAYAAVLGDWPPRFIARRDLAQILTLLDPDPERVLTLARRWRAEAVLARALRETWETLGVRHTPWLVEWARAHRSGRLDRLLVASHLGRARAHTRHGVALIVVSGVRARLAYLRAIAWPQRAYLDARGMTRRGFLARPLGLARRLHP